MFPHYWSVYADEGYPVQREPLHQEQKEFYAEFISPVEVIKRQDQWLMLRFCSENILYSVEYPQLFFGLIKIISGILPPKL